MLALGLAGQKDITVNKAVVYGTSKCIRDGAGTVLQETVQITPEIKPDGCGICVGDGKKCAKVTIKPKIREKLNALNKKFPVEEFQKQGLAYLKSLTQQEIFELV